MGKFTPQVCTPLTLEFCSYIIHFTIFWVEPIIHLCRHILSYFLIIDIYGIYIKEVS